MAVYSHFTGWPVRSEPTFCWFWLEWSDVCLILLRQLQICCIGMACGQRGGTPKSKWTKCAPRPDGVFDWSPAALCRTVHPRYLERRAASRPRWRSGARSRAASRTSCTPRCSSSTPAASRTPPTRPRNPETVSCGRVILIHFHFPRGKTEKPPLYKQSTERIF